MEHQILLGFQLSPRFPHAYSGFNERGELIIHLRISKKVKEGVVSIPQGYWATLLPRQRSVNALTTDCLTDMGNGSAMQETQVQVAKV